MRSPGGCLSRRGVGKGWHGAGGAGAFPPLRAPSSPSFCQGGFSGTPHHRFPGIHHCRWDGRGEAGWLVVQSSCEGNQGSVTSSHGVPGLKTSACNAAAACGPHPRHRCGGTGRCRHHGGWRIPATVRVAPGSRQRRGGPGHVAVRGWLCPCAEPGLAAAAPCGAVIDARSRLAPSINTYTF